MARSTRQLGRRDVIDLAFVVALVGVGLFGFRSSFGGIGFLGVGLGGSLLGAAVGCLVVRLRLSLLVSAAACVLALALFGGFSVPDSALLGFLPTPGSLYAIADGAANGWIRLVTSLVPAGADGNALVVPLLCGYFGAFGSYLLARFVPRVPALCLVPAFVVLGLSVLLGVKEPAFPLIQGGVFAAFAIAWISTREATQFEVISGGARRGRFAAGAVMLGVALVVANLIGGHLPGASAHSRLVLREEIAPPFDPNDYSSPLAGFRAYTNAQPDADHPEPNAKKVMLRVSATPPLPAMTPIRVAVMDAYNGIVWSVGQSSDVNSASSAGIFRRVGKTIPGSGGGEAHDVTVQIVDYNTVFLPAGSVWVPTVGDSSSVRFRGARASDLRKDFRFNTETQAGADTAQLLRGEKYVTRAHLTQEHLVSKRPAHGTLDKAEQQQGLALEGDQVFARVDAGASAETGDDMARATRLEKFFQDGYYYSRDVKSYEIPPGHSVFHMERFLNQALIDNKTVGDEEQYASAMALAARHLGMPSRVALGFRSKAQGRTVSYKGSDAVAWVEIKFANAGWIPFFPTPEHDQIKDQEFQKKPINEQATKDANTPVTAPPPDVNSLQRAAALHRPADKGLGAAALLRLLGLLAKVVGIPVLTVGLPVVLLAVAKSTRRRRRRRRGAPATRIAAGWQETIDIARDLGRPLPDGLTRQEAAQLVGLIGFGQLADTADANLFGPDAPTEDDALKYWAGVDAFTQEAMAPMTRLRPHSNASEPDLVARRLRPASPCTARPSEAAHSSLWSVSMRLKLTLTRPQTTSAPAADILVTVDTTVTVGELAEAIGRRDPVAPISIPDVGVTLAVLDAGAQRALRHDATVADAGLRSGQTVGIVRRPDAQQETEIADAAAVVTVFEGPDTGREFNLGPGASYVGRRRDNHVRLSDPLVSNQHARITIGDTVEVVDLGSSNGVLIGGDAVARAAVGPNDHITLGDTVLRITVRGGVSANRNAPTVEFNRPPRVDIVYSGVEFEAPEVPTPPDKGRFSISAVLAPILMGGVMYLITGNLFSILFIALSPMMMIGSVIEQRALAKRTLREQTEAFHEELGQLNENLIGGARNEVDGRRAEHTSIAELATVAVHRGTMLWTMRPDRRGFLDVRLGTATLPSRNSVKLPSKGKSILPLWQELLDVRDQFLTVDAVPAVASLAEHGAVGIAGARPAALALARSVLAQYRAAAQSRRGGRGWRDVEHLRIGLGLAQVDSAHVVGSHADQDRQRRLRFDCRPAPGVRTGRTSRQAR